MKVASSGSVDGIKVGVGDGDGEEEDEGGGTRVTVDAVVLVVDDAVNRSFNSAARRTMSLALTISASKSFNASDISVAVFCAEVSTVRNIPWIPDRPVLGAEVALALDAVERPFPIVLPSQAFPIKLLLRTA